MQIGPMHPETQAENLGELVTVLVNISCITVLYSAANFNVCHMSMKKQTIH